MGIARELIDSARPMRKTDRLQVQDGAGAEELCAAALGDAARTRRGEEAPALIVECARLSAILPIGEGLAFERRQSLARLNAPQCLAMRYLFFAERQARKNPRFTSQAQDAGKHMLQHMIEAIHGLMAEGVAPDQVDAALHDFGWARGRLSVKIMSGPGERATRSSLDIAYRCMAALQEAGQQALAQYPGLRADDIDAEFCHAHGFPRYRGGPMYFSSHDEQLGAYTGSGLFQNITHEVQQ